MLCFQVFSSNGSIAHVPESSLERFSDNAKVLHSGMSLSACFRFRAIRQDNPDNAVYGPMSMSNFSHINFTICGGNTLALGNNPICVSCSLKGRHQFMSVFTDMPAQSASCNLDMDFIFKLILIRFQVTKYFF